MYLTKIERIGFFECKFKSLDFNIVTKPHTENLLYSMSHDDPFYGINLYEHYAVLFDFLGSNIGSLKIVCH